MNMIPSATRVASRFVQAAAVSNKATTLLQMAADTGGVRLKEIYAAFKFSHRDFAPDWMIHQLVKDGLLDEVVAGNEFIWRITPAGERELAGNSRLAADWSDADESDYNPKVWEPWIRQHGGQPKDLDMLARHYGAPNRTWLPDRPYASEGPVKTEDALKKILGERFMGPFSLS